jgi:predicted transcriptional regulator
MTCSGGEHLTDSTTFPVGWGPRSKGEDVWRRFYAKEISRLWRDLDMDVATLLGKLGENGLNIDRYMLFRIRKGEKSVSFEKILEVHRTLDRLASDQQPTAVDLMSNDPFSLGAENKLANAVNALRQRDFSQAPVLDDGGRVIGVLRIEEVAEQLLRPSQQSRPIKEFLSEASRVSPRTSMRTVRGIVREQGYVLVEERGKLRGIITYSDLIPED